MNPRNFSETHRIYDMGAEEGFELSILTWDGGSDRGVFKEVLLETIKGIVNKII